MTQYMLSVHSVEGEAPPAMSEDEMRQMPQRMGELEDEMKATGAWMFSARLTEADTATVVQDADGEMLTTDGPFAESKEHIAGFYVIEAEDLDGALAWASKVSACIRRPIEVRAFAGFAS